MTYINSITKENFYNTFNIYNVLKDSVFYPAAGIDAKDIESLNPDFVSYVHVDYSYPREVVEKAMKNDFENVGYDLIGIKQVKKEELTPNGFRPSNITFNDHEKQRLQAGFIRDSFYGKNFVPFALWAVYELNPHKTGDVTKKAKRFSLLHVGAEACATFEAIYFANKINPAAVAIISPGEGFGDNWTLFTDPEFRLYKNLRDNANKNGALMPEYLVTNAINNKTQICFWPDYVYHNSCYCCSKYIRSSRNL